LTSRQKRKVQVWNSWNRPCGHFRSDV